MVPENVKKIRLTPAEKALPWPEWVPLPEGVGRGRTKHHDGSPCCALGWIEATFPSNAMQRLARHAYSKANSCGTITLYNDDLRTNKDRAEAYRRAMAALGYTEVRHG